MLQKQWPSISLIQFVLIVMNTLHPPSPLIPPSNPQSWLCPKLLFITLPPPPHPNMSLHTKTKQRPPPSGPHKRGEEPAAACKRAPPAQVRGKSVESGEYVGGERVPCTLWWCVLLYEECCSVRTASALPRITVTHACSSQLLTRRHSERCRAHVRE